MMKPSSFHNSDMPLILFVGDFENRAVPDPVTQIEQTEITDFSNLLPSIQNLHPSIIISPLFTKKFDAMDVAKALTSISYTGRFRVITDNLPEPDLILNELVSIAPKLDIDFIVIAADSEYVDQP